MFGSVRPAGGLLRIDECVLGALDIARRRTECPGLLLLSR